MLIHSTACTVNVTNICQNSPQDLGNDNASKCQRFGMHDRNKFQRVCSPWDLPKVSKSSYNPLECINDCPVQCEIEEFDVRSIPMAFDDIAVSRLLGGNLTDVELQGFMATHSVVHVAFNSFRYTEITQYFPLTLGTLMSNVGGLFGLLLGGSVLTLVHALMFLLHLMYMRYT